MKWNKNDNQNNMCYRHASIMVLVAGITTYNGFMSESTTSQVTQNTASEGPNGDGDGETNDDVVSQH